MGRESFKIVLSILGAGAAGFCAFLLLEAFLPGRNRQSDGAVLFRFQTSAMLAMAIFAGLAIVIYARISR